jgi:hypothetical protein
MKATALFSAIVATLVASPPAFAATNLISDGDFSSPNQGGSWSIYSPGIDGWVNTSNDGIEIGASPIYGLPCANADCQNLEVNANQFDTDQQTVSGLIPGDWYQLSFLYGGRTSGGPDALNVFFGGKYLTTDSGSIGSWSENVFRIQATSSTETLVFSSEPTTGDPSYGNEITNVSLMQTIPEASTWAMLVLGLGCLGFLKRKHHKEAVSAFI